MWKPRKNGSATMVSMTSNKTSLEAAAVDAGTTKRAEAGRTVMDGVTRSYDLATCDLATPHTSHVSRRRQDDARR